jgi:hypothetical protein
VRATRIEKPQLLEVASGKTATKPSHEVLGPPLQQRFSITGRSELRTGQTGIFDDLMRVLRNVAGLRSIARIPILANGCII